MAILAAALLLCPSACKKPAEPSDPIPAQTVTIPSANASIQRFPLQGMVLGKNEQTQELTVKHRDIPGFMSAMTMVYKVKDPATLKTLEPGDRISATLLVSSSTGNALDEIVITDPSQHSLPLKTPPDHALSAAETETGRPNEVDSADKIAQAVLSSWSMAFWPTLFMLLTAIVYLRGWRSASVTRPRELPVWRAFCFLGGLLVLWLALYSPLDALGEFLLTAHMAQHLALMSIVPPLLWLGAPSVPLLRGLPRFLIQEVVPPWVEWKPLHALQKLIAHPLFGWFAMNLAYVGWHVPAAYDLALRSNSWHYLEHGCFFFSSMAFWWTVLQPWPSHNRWSSWMLLPYLITADIVNTAVSASLAFSGRVVYPTYAHVPRIFEISAMTDQVAAGAGMWVIGSAIYLVPLMIMVYRLLLPRPKGLVAYVVPDAETPQPRKIPAPFDLLKVPLLGAFLRSRHGRILLQSVSFIGIAAIILHGLLGTQLSPMNLAGAFLWNIARPILFLLIIYLGNVFCMACPFTFPRELARKLHTSHWHWPSALRNKWTSAVLMALFSWGYIQFDFWNSPFITAWILIGYIVAAFLVDTVFQGASFCKYVCPIGQFNFVASIVSPLELGVKSQQACSDCSTKDCIRGNQTQRGCELQLYLPQKIGNLDCTLCMDCVKACPHENVEIALHLPTRDLIHDPLRSSLRRLSGREDIATMVLVVVFSSLVNAAGMISPVVNFFASITQQYPLLSGPFASLLFTFAICGGLLLMVIGMTQALRFFSAEKCSKTLYCRFSLATLPLGLAMWTAHLLFHLATAASSTLPILDQFASDFRAVAHVHAAPINAMLAALPAAMPASCAPMMVMLTSGSGGTNLLSLQLWILDVGLLFSLYAGWRIIRQLTSTFRDSMAMLALWAISSTAFYALCVWVFTQPMQMRGMGMQ